MTPAEAMSLGDDPRSYVRGVLAGYPTEEDRRKDWAVHIRVSERLRRGKPKGKSKKR
jgi:hypothetical protein